MVTSLVSAFATQAAMALPEAGLLAGVRAASFDLNRKAVQNNVYEMPIDVTAYIHGVVSGVINPIDAVVGFNYHAFKAREYTPDFFQHHNFTVTENVSMLDFMVTADFSMIPEMKNAIDPVVWQTAKVVEGDDILTLLNRGNIDYATAQYYLHRMGIRDERAKQLVLSLRNEIPPVSDLIRFAVRDAFYPDIVADYGEANEYPKIIDKYISWQGLGWDTGYMAPDSIDADGNAVPAHPATWGEIAWFAHWEFPSWSQGQDMMFRLYADSRYGPSPYVLNPFGDVDKERVFDSKDLNRLLRASGYSSYWRDKLELIAEPPLARVDVRRMHQIGVIDDAAVYHNYRAQGYGDQKAKWLTDFTIAKERPSINSEVCKLFKIGVLSEDEATKILLDNLVSKEEAQYALTKCKLDLRVMVLEETIKTIHKATTEGQIDINQSRGALATLSIGPDRIKDYMALWQLEISMSHRIPTLSMIVGWYVDGIIDRDDLIGRLQRLNYSDTDINKILSEADRKKIRKQTKDEAAGLKEKEREAAKQEKADRETQRAFKARQTAIAKAAKEQSAALEKEQKAREKLLSEEQKQLQARLKAETKALAAGATDKELVDYWKAGVIDLNGIRVRLASRGFIPDTIEKWIATYLKG